MAVQVFSNGLAAPFSRAEIYEPDQLIAGALYLVTQPVIISSGVCKRGSVLGQASSYAIEVAAGAGNSGNGTIGTAATGAAAKLGAYQLTAKSATAFGVVDPEGVALADATVGTLYEGEILFLVSAGSASFVAGDSFAVDVLDAVGTFKLCVKTATDGTETPVAVLLDDVDASAGPVEAGAYFVGEFNARSLIFDASWTLQDMTTALRKSGIFVKSSVSAADPS
jgi:hypothetical protein